MRTDELVLVEEEIINRMDLTQDLKEEEVCELIDTEILREGKRRHLELSSMTILRKNIYHAIRELVSCRSFWRILKLQRSWSMGQILFSSKREEDYYRSRYALKRKKSSVM